MRGACRRNGPRRTARPSWRCDCSFHQGLIRPALIVYPKPLVLNWTRELRRGPRTSRSKSSTATRTTATALARLKLPAQADQLRVPHPRRGLGHRPRVQFDVVVLDEAQRLKNRESKTAQVVAALRATEAGPSPARRSRITRTTWSTSSRSSTRTGCRKTRRRNDSRLDERLHPRRQGGGLRQTSRKVVREIAYVSRRRNGSATTGRKRRRHPAQRARRDHHRAARLRALVMRLKQICNFDPLTGDSRALRTANSQTWKKSPRAAAKSNLSSQWVEPPVLAGRCEPYGPLLYHGHIPQTGDSHPRPLQRTQASTSCS